MKRILPHSRILRILAAIVIIIIAGYIFVWFMKSDFVYCRVFDWLSGPADMKPIVCTIYKNTPDNLQNNNSYINNILAGTPNGAFVANCGGQGYYQGYYIASAQENLDKYLGKKVRLTTSYPKDKCDKDSVQVNQQCIAGKCQPLLIDGRSFYAIIIEKIEEL